MGELSGLARGRMFVAERSQHPSGMRWWFMSSDETTPKLGPFDEFASKVLNSIPPGSSPVFSLLPEVFVAPQALAPERRDALVPHLRPIKLFCKTGRFIFSTDGEHINVSDGALDLVWCTSLASWYIYQAFAKAQKNRLTEVRLGTDQNAIDALDLYEWAIRCVRNRQYEPWPDGAPRPTRLPDFGSPTHVANEVFLTAVAWILLHETGHIALKHPLLQTLRARVEENEADSFATHHVLDGVSETDVLFKRGLGIVVANVILVLLDLISGQVDSASYPTVEERLTRNLRGNQLGL